VNVIEGYGRTELELQSLLISALDKRGQLHTPAALLPGISASVFNQQECWRDPEPVWGTEKSTDLPEIKSHSSVVRPVV